VATATQTVLEEARQRLSEAIRAYEEWPSPEREDELGVALGACLAAALVNDKAEEELHATSHHP
jgi:hypothetical protein